MTQTKPPITSSLTGKWKPYPAYEDSGVEWLGEIPEHWNTKPLKYTMRFINGAPFKPSDWEEEGIPIIRIENLNGSNEFHRSTMEIDSRYFVAKGDLLFAWSGNRGTSFGPFIWRNDGNYYLNQHIFRLDDFNEDEMWLYWKLKGVTAYVESQAHGIIGLVHITKQDLGIIHTPIISEEEQRAIAAFLNRETAKINSLITKKERLIELLQEKRVALISHTVTKGLDPMVPMKDSGVEWIGEIPAHWRMKRLKFCLHSIEQGWSPTCENRPAERDEWGVLKVGCVNGIEFNQDENKALPLETKPLPELEIKSGDVLMSRANTRELLGSASVVTRVRPRLLLCDKLYRLKIHSEKLSSTYLVLAMGSSIIRFQLERDATGASSSMQNISQSIIRNLIIPFPDKSEQQAIIDYLNQETTKIDALISRIRDGIEKLKEYSSALISAAVTGKIDVRDNANNLGVTNE